MRVLVVDDEPQLVQALTMNLRARRYEVHAASSGAAALQVAVDFPPDVVLLDLGLPDMDGVEVIHGLRASSSAPIIVLSGRIGGLDKVSALDAGADDYVIKPFGMDELMARIRAVARRSAADHPAEPASVRIGDWLVDLAAHRIAGPDGAEQRLTKIEWQLLERLVRHPGQLITQRQLLAEVWGPQFVNESGYLRFHFGQLRRKLEADPGRPRHLVTEPGIGYRFHS
ncbi:MAG: response regulator [Actinomycetota bacterium]|nr:response regulator [Actinomycetota bacterium]MDQ2956770.1 response regulator [Actinomycetota bacterium]